MCSRTHLFIPTYNGTMEVISTFPRRRHYMNALYGRIVLMNDK